MAASAYLRGRVCGIRTLELRGSTDSLPAMSQPFTAPETPADVERYIRENDVRFLFAQFVDMHGKPNAKLVPARPLAHAAAVAARRGPARLRRPRGGRGVALLPAHDPAPPARARPLDGVRVHARRGARVFPRQAARRRLDRAGRPARHP